MTAQTVRTKGLLNARYAQLVKEFGLSLDAIYDLTPRQIEDIYFHPRDENGEVVLPKAQEDPTWTPERIVAATLNAAKMLQIPESDLAGLKVKLEQKFSTGVSQNGDSAGQP